MQTATLATRLPACLGVPQAEVDTVQALVCIGAIAAFVTTLGMAHTLKTQALLFTQRDAFSIQSSPWVPLTLQLPGLGNFLPEWCLIEATTPETYSWDVVPAEA